MSKNRLYWYKRGLRDGIPIGLGYFAVAFTLGLAACEAGLGVFQAGLSSLLLNASAGQFIAYTLISQNAGIAEMIIMEAVANARYLLMSASLSQKITPDTPIWQRIFVGYYVTDEIFSTSYAVSDKLSPYYTMGEATLAEPGWVIGTMLGVVVGSILPVRLVSAFNVTLYGMFIASFVPPARKNKVVLGCVIISFISSWLFSYVNIAWITDSVKIIVLTVVISLIAAIIFPVKNETEKTDEEDK